MRRVLASLCVLAISSPALAGWYQFPGNKGRLTAAGVVESVSRVMLEPGKEWTSTVYQRFTQAGMDWFITDTCDRVKVSVRPVSGTPDVSVYDCPRMIGDSYSDMTLCIDICNVSGQECLLDGEPTTQTEAHYWMEPYAVGVDVIDAAGGVEVEIRCIQ